MESSNSEIGAGTNNFGRKIRKPRTATACNFCRHRKIKCDGKLPCSNCQETDSQNCVYTAIIPKISRNERKDKNKSLEDRLANVERLLEVLSNKSDILLPDTSLLQLLPIQEMNISQEYSNSVQDTPNDTPTSKDNNESENVHIERFSGSHFHFCTHSSKFVDQLRGKLPIKYHDLLIPLENMPSVFTDSVKSFEKKWIEAPSMDLVKQKQLLQAEFPIDFKTVIKLIEKYYSQDILANYICTIEELKFLFGLYYQNNGIRSCQLKESELLIMNIAIVMSIRAALEDIGKGRVSHDFFSLSSKELQDIYDQRFITSILLHNRCLLLSDGIQTVKALMLLVLLTEFNIANSRLDRGLLSLAIRYAQDVGLHEFTKFSGLTEEQSILRKKLWCTIEYFDVEMAYRKGVQPLIQLRDCLPDCEGMEKQTFHVVNDIFGADYEFDYMMAYYDFIRAMTRLRNKTYRDVGTFRSESYELIHDKTEDLLGEMKDLALLFPLSYRPTLVSDVEFDIGRFSDWINTGDQFKMGRFLILTAHISYFSHLMFINTIPFMHELPPPGKLETAYHEYKRTGINCARTILEMSIALKCPELPAVFLNIIIHHIVSAFLCILYKCIANIDDPHNSKDIHLLIRVSNTALSFSDFDLSESIGGHFTKDKKYELLCVVAFNIGSKVIDIKTQSDSLANETQFKEHVNKLARWFPSVFQNNAITSSPCNSDNASSSSSRSESTPIEPHYTHGKSKQNHNAGLDIYDNIRVKEGGESPILNEFSTLPLDYGVSNVHDFFFDSTFGI